MSKEKVIFDYDPKKRNHLYPVLRPVSTPLIHIVFKYDLIGKENLPENGGFILACNHVTAIDPVFLVSSIAPKEVHFMGKDELFEKPFSRWFLTGMNGFPIHRQGVDVKGIKYAEALLEQGDVLGIFPEGTRSKTREPQRAKAGVALIAKATHADVVPMSIYFSEKPHYRSRLTVRIGEPIRYEELGLSDEERNTQELRAAAALVMERIKALWSMGHA